MGEFEFMVHTPDVGFEGTIEHVANKPDNVSPYNYQSDMSGATKPSAVTPPPSPTDLSSTLGQGVPAGGSFTPKPSSTPTDLSSTLGQGVPAGSYTPKPSSEPAGAAGGSYSAPEFKGGEYEGAWSSEVGKRVDQSFAYPKGKLMQVLVDSPGTGASGEYGGPAVNQPMSETISILFENDAEFNFADTFDLESVSNQDMDEFKAELAAVTEQHLDARNLPNRFTVFRGGQLFEHNAAVPVSLDKKVAEKFVTGGEYVGTQPGRPLNEWIVYHEDVLADITSLQHVINQHAMGEDELLIRNEALVPEEQERRRKLEYNDGSN